MAKNQHVTRGSQHVMHQRERLDYVGVRIGAELRARMIYAAQQLGIPLSEWLRMVVASALDNGINGMNGPHDPASTGYLHGRALGLSIAQAQIQSMLRDVVEQIPMTIEEATARGLMPVYGYEPGY